MTPLSHLLWPLRPHTLCCSPPTPCQVYVKPPESRSGLLLPIEGGRHHVSQHAAAYRLPCVYSHPAAATFLWLRHVCCSCCVRTHAPSHPFLPSAPPPPTAR